MSLKIIFVIFISASLLFSNEYFVRFSSRGLSYREEFIQQKWDKIPSISKLDYPAKSQLNLRKITNSQLFESRLEKWLIIDLSDENKNFLNALYNDNLIDFFEPVGHFKIDFQSQDSLSGEQWYLDKIDLAPAWKITKGSPNIIVAIIDTGIDYEHPDLVQSIWVNRTEDLNHNGILDSQDLNNVDDDGNGFIDDVVGWDFTDAPRFADGGDYKDPDNLPQDEFGTGHGTQIAGIIAARDNNQIGITGIAPNVKIMNIRAGTAAGYLEEDDVASAILYAVDNGAQIINMSFGDVVLSRFLNDVIQYAYEMGLIMVASAGNSSSNEVHFPSGLAETISVGASTEADGVAGFSNFGTTIDLLAPGTDIVSTAINGKYNTVNGTSFSAPIISAAAALLLSKSPGLTNEQVRNVLKSTANDILATGWDELSGNGRVSALRALQVPYGGILKINSPSSNASTAKNIECITGSIAHPDLINSVVEYGIGQNPDNWHILRETEKSQIIDDTLAVLDLSQIADTSITIRMKMHLYNDLVDENRITFNVDRSAPQISGVKPTFLWDGPVSSVLISFITDDVCTSELKIRPKNSTGGFVSLGSQYETQNHVLKIDQEQLNGASEFCIKCQNRSGLITIDDNNGLYYPLMFDRNFTWTEFNKLSWKLPAGFMLNNTTDLDHDGRFEIVMSRYDQNNAFGPIEVYEFNNGTFDLCLKTGFTAIPRDAGDVDGDGKSDLLLGFGQHSFLLESMDTNSFPTEMIWQDSINFWAASITDLDNDQKYEITGRVDSAYVVLENNGDNSFSEIVRLKNPTTGQNLLGVPEIELTDLTNDSIKEIVFGDYDGDLVAYKTTGDNQFQVLSTGKTLNTNATELLTSDISGHIIAATHPSENLNYEHEFDARFWTIEIFSQDESGLSSREPLNTFGFSSTKEFDSGLSYHVFDNTAYLFASFFPNLFIFENINNSWQPVWLYNQARSNTVLVADLDNDTYNEFYFNDGNNIIGFSATVTNRPMVPLFFQARCLDSTRTLLNWQGVPNAQHFKVYRGDIKNELIFLTTISKNSFVDTSLQVDKKYFYAVSTIDSTYQENESFFSNIDSAQTEYPPNITSVNFVNDHQLLLNFDSKIKLLAYRPSSVFTINSQAQSSSIIQTNSGRSLLVSFNQAFFKNQDDTLCIQNVFGENGADLDKRSWKKTIKFIPDLDHPYIVKTSWLSKNELQVDFSDLMLESDLSNLQNYLVQPVGSVQKIDINDDLSKIIVSFDNNTFIGPTGQSSFLVLHNLHGQNGMVLEDNNSISLFRQSIELKNILIYPQPVEPYHNELIFANLPGDVTITIFTLSGRPVQEISQRTSYGGVKWDLHDKTGAEVANGIYFYDLRWKDERKQGKIVIIR